MRLKFYIFALLVSAFALNFVASAQTGKPATTRIISVLTEPNAIVWIDDIKRGTTDNTGKLLIKNAPAGIRRLRVRANGFKEVSQTLTALQKGSMKVALVKTTDEAELVFQRAESETDHQKAIELYQQAVKLNPKNAQAFVGLARVLSSEGDPEEALKAIAAARRIRPGYAEASAVEGRVYFADGEEAKAIASFKRAITEGKGFQPEAHVGLGLLYKERFGGAADENNPEKKKANYLLAANELKIGISQLSGAPDAVILYQTLGEIYEESQNYKQAIATYEEFLQIFPDSNDASAVSSMIVQLKKQMNGEQ
jgi:tetratricopeptide (TPR) repeat protein